MKNIKESVKPYVDNIKQLHQLLEIELETSTHFFDSENSSDYRKLEKIKWKVNDLVGYLEDYLGSDSII